MIIENHNLVYSRVIFLPRKFKIKKPEGFEPLLVPSEDRELFPDAIFWLND